MLAKNKKNTIKKIIFVVISVVVAIIFTLPYVLFREKIQELVVLGYMGLIVSCTISNVSILLPSSSTLIVVVAASVLNPYLCIVFGAIGAALGEQSSYLCGRIGSTGFIYDSNYSKKTNSTLRWLKKKPLLTIFIFAFVPLPIFDIVGVAAGASRISWWKYTVAAVLGKTMKFLFAVVVVYYVLPFLIKSMPGPGAEIMQHFIEQLKLNN